MRANQLIIERTKTHLQILDELADLVIQKLPDVIEEGYYKEFRLSDMSKFGAISKRHADKYQDFLNVIANLPIYIMNNKFGNPRTFGAVLSTASGPIEIHFHVRAFFGGEVRDVRKSELLGIKSSVGNSFKSVVVHEFRHVMQIVEYPEFYSKSGEFDYNKSPVEIDAAWFHSIQDYNPSDYDDGAKYADDVMASFSSYKSLTHKQFQHYRRKTIKYFADHKLKDTTDEPLSVRYARKRKELSDKIVSGLKPNYDFRNIPDYDGGNFIIDERVVGGIRGIVQTQKPFTNPPVVNVGLVYTVLALTYPRTTLATVKKYLESIGYSLTTALSSAEAFNNQKFDGEAITNFIRQSYT